MCKQNLFLACVALVLCIANSAPPPGLTICKEDDSKCVQESSRTYKNIFASGLPQYGVEVLDPLKIKNINASLGNLLFTLSDVTVVGLKKCDIQKVTVNIENMKISIKMLCTATLDGDYVLKGSVLVLPIEGNGKLHVDLRSAFFNLDIDMLNKIINGKKHWSVKSFKHTFELKEKSNVVFENLFNGNEILGQAASELIANNGNDVIYEIGAPVIKHVVTKVVKNVNYFFKAVPAEDLALPN